MSYPFKEIEKKWQNYWDKNNTYFTDLDNQKKPKCYLLDMFPYPSGTGLHVGHPKGYTATDILTRYKLMNGFNVLHPIGWDAFGLPAEQYALNTGNDPSVFTEQNIDKFRKQLKKLGFAFDYTKEVNTTDPNYYKTTQWIFIKLFEKGLAKLEQVEVNFCRELGTVLANEEIINVNGKMVSERGNYPVEKKPMLQWVLKITQYAEKLLAGLETLDWPNSVKELQKNWIGKSEGVIVNFFVKEKKSTVLKIFTSRVDTIFGVSFIAVSPEHGLLHELINSQFEEAANKYLKAIKSKTELMRQSEETLKTGVFTGSYAFHPFTKELIPIWIGDYVLANYGTGAVMGVPNADQRDFLFAKNHKIKSKKIFSSNFKNEINSNVSSYINSEFINGHGREEAKKLVIERLKKMNIGHEYTAYKLRDWLFSRQRYWGEPFPIIHWNDNSITALKYSELPLTLPKVINFKPSPEGNAPLINADKSWLRVIRDDGVEGRREINTMPQWAGSCWYYLAYLLKKSNGNYLDFVNIKAKERFKFWLPVDLYIGGQEHAVLHLLYARFWNLVLFDLGLVPFAEPFSKLINQGMILGENNEKMSKSKGNVINPDDIIEKYGADTLRLYEMFIGPLTATLSWKSSGLIGIHKFLTRIYRFFTDPKYVKKICSNNNGNLDSIYHQTIAKVTNDIENCAFNTSISQLMIFINECYKKNELYKEHLKGFLKILYPFAPHLSSELWSYMSNKKLETEEWPKYNNNILITEQVKIAVQVNGKTKHIIEIKRNSSQEEVFSFIKKNIKVKSVIESKILQKIIYIENKVINLVVKDK